MAQESFRPLAPCGEVLRFHSVGINGPGKPSNNFISGNLNTLGCRVSEHENELAAWLQNPLRPQNYLQRIPETARHLQVVGRS